VRQIEKIDKIIYNTAMAQYFTKEGLQRLKDELHDIKTNQVTETKKLIAEARAFGDLKENAGYHDARDKMSFLLGRVEQLEIAINEAVIKEKDEGNAGIQIGSKVKILFDKEEQEYEIVAPTEADILKNKISYKSPLGLALMSKEAGKVFDFMAGNNRIKVKVLEVK
jgi:transcription elongation factor GreA